MTNVREMEITEVTDSRVSVTCRFAKADVTDMSHKVEEIVNLHMPLGSRTRTTKDSGDASTCSYVVQASPRMQALGTPLVRRKITRFLLEDSCSCG